MKLYLVKTDGWYTERAGWGIAGVFGLTATLLAAFVHPAWVLLVGLVGMISLVNAATGFCPVSTALLWLGLPARLPAPGPAPRVLGVPIYRMKTDAWFLERAIYAVVGVNLSLASALVLVHSPWWLLFTGFVGIAAVAFAWTGFCPVANVLFASGFEPRLGPREVAQSDGRMHAA